MLAGQIELELQRPHDHAGRAVESPDHGLVEVVEGGGVGPVQVAVPPASPLEGQFLEHEEGAGFRGTPDHGRGPGRGGLTGFSWWWDKDSHPGRQSQRLYRTLPYPD